MKLARLYEKISNCRKDSLHKITSRLIRENDAVYLENLNISGMLKNHKLAKNISDCSWNELARQLEYKGSWYGCEVLKINRFYTSSKTCSHCGCIQDKMPLNIRKWTCSKCGTEHDRDINAAINVLMEGKREKSSGAGDHTDGESVSPNPLKRNRRESMKSEAQHFNVV